jgi:ribosomal protein S18 acetylase RimI-like enzyme/ketosteroid isomerase-like protein
VSTLVRLCASTDLAAAADALAAALADYPWTRHVIPDDDYPARLRALQYLYLSHAYQHGAVAVVDDGSGVIALLPPDAPGPDDNVLEQVMALHGDRLDRLAHRRSSGDDWTLETLGVHPNVQGRGAGGALLERGLAEATRRGARAVRLETSSEDNVRLYERHGFRVAGRSDLPQGPTVWTMRAVMAEAGVAAPSAQEAAVGASVDEALEQYLRATNSHDFSQVAAGLAADAVYFFGDATCVGLPAVQEYFEQTWATIPDERYWAEDIAWTARSPHVAAVTYSYHWSGTLPTGPASGSGRATNIFVSTPQGWRLCHEHLSAHPSSLG